MGELGGGVGWGSGPAAAGFVWDLRKVRGARGDERYVPLLKGIDALADKKDPAALQTQADFGVAVHMQIAQGSVKLGMVACRERKIRCQWYVGRYGGREKLSPNGSSIGCVL